MGFPTKRARPKPLFRTMDDMQDDIDALRNIASPILSDVDVGKSTEIRMLVDLMEDFASIRARLLATKDTVGLAQKFRDELDDQTIDIVQDFKAVIPALNAVLVWLRDNLPRSPAGWIYVERFTAAGVREYNALSAAEMTSFKVAVEALLATID